MSQIMEIMIKSKSWVIKWSVCGSTGPFKKNAYVILQILDVLVVVLLLEVTFSFF